MAGFVTVGDIIAEARILLQDTEVGNYRWVDAMLYGALNEGLLSSGLRRPDFFRDAPIPQYAVTDVNLTINYPDVYKPALINFVVGRIEMQDDEATTEAMAAALVNAFTFTLTQPVA